LALAVVARDLSLAKKMVHFASDSVLEEGEMQEKLKLPPTELRQLLYRMQDSNLVIQLGTKEDEAGNRLTYWRINKDLAKSFLIRRFEETVELLRRRKEEEFSGEYYICAADPTHVRLSFDEVISKMDESGLVCPVCGAMLEPVDKERIIEEIDGMVKTLEKALEILEGEVS
ncbi:MAG TPA: hypothetical protein ENF57_03140, partial [Candidatus Korarchaeota archaeon]|nr:hypothetical protein [Candidatus Korarchaeota archaeon]